MEIKSMPFEEFRSTLLYHRIVEWDDNKIVLDNGISISIEETEQECCARAFGYFTDVKLDAAITYISGPKYDGYEGDFGEYGTYAVVNFLHNQNLICRANGDADAGGGGYYYSVASFVIRVPEKENEELHCYFVDSSEAWRNK